MMRQKIETPDMCARNDESIVVEAETETELITLLFECDETEDVVSIVEELLKRA